jgi:hypothetical protein
VDTNAWAMQSIYKWWSFMIKHKDLSSITLLASWGIWNECNTRVFRKKKPPSTLLAKIKDKAKLWVIAGVKSMGNCMREIIARL